MQIVHLLMSGALNHSGHERIKPLHGSLTTLGRIPAVGEEIVLDMRVNGQFEEVVVKVVHVRHIAKSLPDGPCAHIWIE